MNPSAVVRVALGGLLLSRPAQVVRLTQARPSGTVLTTVRLLGGRYLVQGAADLAVPHDRRIDAAVELLHAVSMLPLARRSRPHAALALLSAGAASGLAAVDLAGHRWGRDTAPTSSA